MLARHVSPGASPELLMLIRDEAQGTNVSSSTMPRGSQAGKGKQVMVEGFSSESVSSSVNTK